MTPSSGHTVQQLSAPSSAFLSNIVHLFEVSVQDNNDDLDEAFAGAIEDELSLSLDNDVSLDSTSKSSTWRLFSPSDEN